MSLRKTPSNWKLASITNSAAKTTGNLHKRKFQNADNNKAETSHAKRNLMKTLSSIKSSPSTRKPNQQRLMPVQQKSAKSPMKKVRVLQDTMRRSSGVGRRSMGHAAKKARTKGPVPEIRIRGPSDEENDGFITDNDNAKDDTYDSFEKSIEPAARSSILPQKMGSSFRGALKLRKRL